MPAETYPIEFTANQVQLIETLLNVAKDDLPLILENSALTKEEFNELYGSMMKASINLVMAAHVKERAAAE